MCEQGLFSNPEQKYKISLKITFYFRLFAHKLQSTDRYLRKMKSNGSKSFNRKESLFCEADVSKKPLTSVFHAEPHLPFEVLKRGKCWVEEGLPHIGYPPKGGDFHARWIPKAYTEFQANCGVCLYSRAGHCDLEILGDSLQ